MILSSCSAFPVLVINALLGLALFLPITHLKYSWCCLRLMMFSPFLSLYIVT